MQGNFIYSAFLCGSHSKIIIHIFCVQSYSEYDINGGIDRKL